MSYSVVTPVNRHNRNIALDYLRAFVVLLVVAHHTALAYTTFLPAGAATFSAQSPYWRAFPILDHARWIGFDVLIGWNDIFFMSLMFLLSGLFVWRGLEKRGAVGFLRQRLLRLGLPFVVAVVVLSPLAYYPTYKLTATDPHITAYAKAWLSLSNWPSGPAWFLWVLLAFDCLAAAYFVLVPRSVKSSGLFRKKIGERPIVFYFMLVIASAVAYLPMVALFGPERWSSFGPFTVQTSRILQYCLYFSVGVWLGQSGSGENLLSASGKLAQRWWLWGLAAFFFYAGETVMLIRGNVVGAEIGFVLSCAASCLFLISSFLRFTRKTRIGDSLSRNSYGIYILHYVFVVWLQFALLNYAFSAPTKAFVVFVGAVTASWALTSIFRVLSAALFPKGFQHSEAPINREEVAA